MLNCFAAVVPKSPLGIQREKYVVGSRQDSCISRCAKHHHDATSAILELGNGDQPRL